MTVRILFVDDEPEFVRAHIDTLQDVGYDVKHVGSYAEALEALERQGFDLIVLDLILPPHDTDLGYETTEPDAEVGLGLHRVIREELDPKVPIIFFTVVNEMEIRHRIQETEAEFGLRPTILIKPVLPSKLLILVRRLVGGK